MHKRRQYLINPKFQWTIVGFFITVALIACTSFYVMIHFYLRDLARVAAKTSLPNDSEFFVLVFSQASVLNSYYVITAMAVFIFIGVGGILLSHKVAGPIYRLQTHMKSNHKDNCPSVKFRKGDFFIELQDCFNDFVDGKTGNNSSEDSSSEDNKNTET